MMDRKIEDSGLHIRLDDVYCVLTVALYVRFPPHKL